MLRNVTINTSVGPLVGIAAENGVVYINGTPHALTMYGFPTNTSHSPRHSPASPRR